MEKAFEIAQSLSWPIAIVALIVAGLNYYIAMQIKKSREDVRKLRVALERDPTPGQLGEALRNWPDIGGMPPGLQLSEMIQRSHKEEHRRAERSEKLLSLCRTFVIVALLPIAVIVTGMFWTPK